MAGVNGVQETNNTGLYAGSIGAGAVAGGLGAYYFTKAIKDGEPTDKFVSHVAEALDGDAKTALDAKAAVKPELKTYLEELKDTAKTPYPTDAAQVTTLKDKIKTTLVGHGVAEESITKGLEGVKDADSLKAFAESQLATATSKGQKEAIKGLIKDGAFITEGENKTLGEALSKAASGFKWKAAAKWAAICAVVAGIGAWICSKAGGNAPAEQSTDKVA